MRAMQPSAPPEPAAVPERAWPGAALFGGLGLALIALLASRELSPETSRAQGGAVPFIDFYWSASTTDRSRMACGACAAGLA